MKILTLTQPFATLAALLAKGIETRSWSTSYCGPIAIHAGAGLGPVGGRSGLHKLCCREPFTRVLAAAGYSAHLVPAWGLPLGAIVAVAELVDCVSTDLMQHKWRYAKVNERLMPVHTWQMTDQERAFGDYSPGRYAWLLAEIRPLREPLPYRGAQGLRPLPVEVAAQVEALTEYRNRGV